MTRGVAVIGDVGLNGAVRVVLVTGSMIGSTPPTTLGGGLVVRHLTTDP